MRVVFGLVGAADARLAAAIIGIAVRNLVDAATVEQIALAPTTVGVGST